MTVTVIETLADAWPRDDPDYRFRLYRRIRGGVMEVVSASPTAAGACYALGLMIEEGEWDAEDRPGVLDVMAEAGNGEWIVSPFS